MPIPKMRTIQEAVTELKQFDEKSAVTVYYVRRLVLSGKLPCLNVGNKRLIDLNVLIEYLSNPLKYENNSVTDECFGNIRRLG